MVISLSDAVKVNPSFVKSNLIPARAGTKFLVDIAFETLFKFSNNTFFSIVKVNSIRPIGPKKLPLHYLLL